MLLSMMSAFVLLAEAMIAVVFARNWALSWWEWHLLLLAAFGLVAAGARIQWHEERFADLYLDDTLAGEREISVLFADLEGFTSFSEDHQPAEVTAMLNTYFEAVVPPIVSEFGGDVERIIGDALMVTFNKRGDQPNHARLAASAGLALQNSAARVAQAHPEWPRFRVGINSGPVALGVLGTEGARTHTVIGDIVNVASRLESIAPRGEVAIGPGTKALLPDADTESLGVLHLKGKAQPLEAFRLIALHRHHA
jgi:class 3 adenylate cyclase